MIEKYITLLSGTQLLLDETQTIILPEDNSEVQVGDEIILENEKRERLGTGIVRSAVFMPYCHLQQFHFAGSAHSGITSWGAGSEKIKELVPGFSIMDLTSVLQVKITTLIEPTLNVHPARSVVVDSEPTPTVEAAFAHLEEVVTQ